nr:MAG TPA: hypothetical protein [Caudoviricetes sp.]
MARCNGLGTVKELKMSQWVIRSRNSYYNKRWVQRLWGYAQYSQVVRRV